MKLINFAYCSLFISAAAVAQAGDDAYTRIKLVADVANSTSSAYGGSIVNTVNDPSLDAPTQFWSSADGFAAKEPEGEPVKLVYSLADGALTLSKDEKFAVDLYGRDRLNDRSQNIEIKLLKGGIEGELVASAEGVAIPESSPCYVRTEFSPASAFDTIVVMAHDTTQGNGNEFVLMEIHALSYDPDELAAASILPSGATAEQIVAQYKKDDKLINSKAWALLKESRETLEERLAWWEEARFGMFVHYGVYANLAGAWDGKVVNGYASHIRRSKNITASEYMEEVVQKFNPEKFDADEWIQQCKATGMRYFVITAKHHDGFAIWDSDYPYNIVDQTPFNRDILKELRDACKRHGIRFGVYYSHAQDWEHEGGQRNRADFPDHPVAKGSWYNQAKYIPHLVKTRKYVDEKAIPQLEELITEYSPEIIWFDTPTWLPDYELNRLYVRTRELDPNVIISSRVGRGFFDYRSTCDKPEDFPPVDGRFWEAIPTTNEAYGYNRYDKSHKTSNHFIQLLTKCVAQGGNLLLNVGPRGDGLIDEADQKILRGIGTWMDVNSAAIYGCGQATLPMQSWGYVTQGIRADNENELYLLIERWPSDGKLIVHGLANLPETITALAQKDLKLTAKKMGDGAIVINLPEQAFDPTMSVVRLEYPEAPKAEQGPQRLLANIDANEMHVFYTDERSPGIENGTGAHHDNTAFGWQDPSQFISWNVYNAEPNRYRVEVTHYPRNPSYPRSRQSKITESAVGEELVFSAGKAVAKGAIVGLGADTDPSGDDPQGDSADGYAKQTGLLTTVLGEVTIPSGQHSLTLRVSHFPKGAGFFPQTIRLVPLPN